MGTLTIPQHLERHRDTNLNKRRQAKWMQQNSSAR